MRTNRSTFPMPENDPFELNAVEAWEQMIIEGVPIGGEWIAVQVKHTNTLRVALDRAQKGPA